MSAYTMKADTALWLLNNFEEMFHTKIHYDVVDYADCSSWYGHPIPDGTPIVALTLQENDPLLVTDVLQFVPSISDALVALLAEMNCTFDDFVLMCCMHRSPRELISDPWIEDHLREYRNRAPESDFSDIDMVLEEMGLAKAELSAELKDTEMPEWWDSPIDDDAVFMQDIYDKRYAEAEHQAVEELKHCRDLGKRTVHIIDQFPDISLENAIDMLVEERIYDIMHNPAPVDLAIPSMQDIEDALPF